MLNKELEQSLNDAFKQAHEKRHEFITVEHLLLAMMSNKSACEVFEASGGNVEAMTSELEAYLEESTPIIPSDVERETQPTLGFQRVLQRAVFHVQSSGKKEVTGANVLVAIFSEQDSQAVYLMSRQNVTRLDVVNFISHGIARIEEDDMSDFEEVPASEGEEASNDPLTKYAVNLNEQAKLGKIDPLIGREKELERTIQTLCRRRKNNPLLVGEAGVGKTAIAEGLALKIVEGNVPEVLEETTIYSLDMGTLVAGTKYRGDFEKRLKGLVNQLKKQEKSILFIDEIHTIIGAGSASGSVMDASNMIKPALASGELRCIGSTTYKEFRGIFEKDHALARRFQKIDVNEPSVDDTIRILKGLKPRYEEHHNIEYSAESIETAAKLADRYLNDRFLPDKAIDVIDEAGAKQRLLPEADRPPVILTSDIEKIIAQIARIPEKSISSQDKDKLKDLARHLKMVVFGQDEAIEKLSDAVILSRAGLGQEERTIGSFLFAGPTGVGKTEVTNQLAKIMGVDLIRFDMSEYMERHTVSRLIGSPPGYVGYDQGGLLTEEVNKHPYAILLLDEIEKAHPDIFNLLLQIMDHGTLTDNNGRKADFRNIMLVMTTNAGAQEASRASIGFTEQEHSSDSMQVIEKSFSPEFRNRLDAVVQFKSLDEDTIIHVVDKFIFELESQLHDKNVSLTLEPEARSWLAKKGYDPKMGARPMERTVQEHIKKPLANELLFGRLTNGGTVKVYVKDNKIDFIITEATKDLIEQR
ncbi:ATP-dependent Clp protease ATP-binding subunit ClpA [Cycloclasticus sp.]|uniref:ATP-dependent Clp protease ATP-binding subunit ClpA n=1 Tax=Cycloclasticus sp. TaxID=2024830 RepID=UPI000C0DDEA8|nr:ATP-dependent Clp protease ATP-binding subunit ClpA [Cycloclasticus sp.]PHR49421.1 MAG: ATP-dependent Clp protease ATP-binding subunit ClpA [Cycloclasticus sp.]